MRIRTIDEVKADLEKEPPEGCKLKVGDTVTYTNSYGVMFKGKKIIGFAKPENYIHGRFIHLDYDCYWFPVKPEDLTRERRA